MSRQMVSPKLTTLLPSVLDFLEDLGAITEPIEALVHEAQRFNEFTG